MPTVLLTKGQDTRPGMKKKTLAERVTIGANTLVIVLITLICMVSVAYLVHANKSAAKGYVLKELKEEEKVLQQKANYWALKVSKSKSLSSLSNSKIQQSMRPTNKVVFIKGDTAVALLK